MSIEDRKRKFLDKVKKNRPDLTILGEYNGSNHKILVKGNQCGHLWQTTPNNMRIGIGCPLCFNERLSKKLTYTNDQYKKKIESINPDYEPLDEYIKSSNYMSFRCKLHNHIWKMRAGHIKSDSCHLCKLDKKREQIHNIIMNANKNIELLSNYVDCHTPIKIRCSIDGYISAVKPLHLKSGNYRCDLCKKNDISNNLIKELSKMAPHIEIIDDVVNIDDQIFYKIKGDTKIYEDTLTNILKNAKRSATDKK